MDGNTCSEYFAPGCEHQEQMDREEGPTMSEAYGCFDPGKHAPEYDIGLELGIARKQLDEDISQLGELDDNSYRDMVRNLNVQQKEFFNHVFHWHKTKTDPMYVLLTGGAGVGKSVVTRALYQALLKYYSHQVSQNPDNLHVLLCAPTGKAAHNINGATVYDSWIFCQNLRDYGPLEINLWKDNFKMYELTIIMRQKEDFAELLNRLREGHHTVDDINILKQHVKEENNQMSSFPHLFTTRKEVQMYNTVVYNEAERDKHKIT